MKTTPPTQAVLIISIILAALALLVFTGTLNINFSAFWLAMGAYILLLLGNLVRGL